MEQLLYVSAHAQRLPALDEILHLPTLPEGTRIDIPFVSNVAIPRGVQVSDRKLSRWNLRPDRRRASASERDPAGLRAAHGRGLESRSAEGSGQESLSLRPQRENY